MNDNLKSLIKAVAENDNQKAKAYAKIIIDADTTQSNKSFCNNIKNKLQTPTMNMIELPYDLKGILYMEDVSLSFNENRYYLSDREKSILDEVIGMYQTSQTLSEMGINYLNSLMLHGESGTGKTLFGRYIAYKLGLSFAYMNFSNIISSYLGSTGKNISKAFEFIKTQKCVLMIDETDAIGMFRGKEDVGEMGRITIVLMQELDCIKSDTVIVGATNRLDMIDSALLRRFANVHKVETFSSAEIESMILRFVDDVQVKCDPKNIKLYCKTAKNQALVINDVVRAIAQSIRFATQFKLEANTVHC